MLNRAIAFAIQHRQLVLITAAVLLVYGGQTVARLPVDVFPDLNRPTVTVMAEAHGLAPEEVEALVTFPIESTLNGATGVQRVRSSSAIGFSIVWAEFDWDTNVYTARQVVNERLQLAQEHLPEGIMPVLAPVSSIMGEIMLIGLTLDAPAPPQPQLATTTETSTSLMELRTLADWVVRPRLLSIPGVAQVSVMGGERKQFHVLTSPERLRQYDVSLQELTDALRDANLNTSGGFLQVGSYEYLIRSLGRAHSAEDLARSVVHHRNGAPVYVRHVARVVEAPQVKRGDGSLNGDSAVIMTVQKQPGADTLVLTDAIDQAVDAVGLPPDVHIHRDIFRQSDFIEASIDNVKEALLHGAVLVSVVLFLFMLNLRTTLITLTSIPLSLVIATLVFRALGWSINTMTLGGLAIAIGVVVDDAIIDVENIQRRLAQNRGESPLRVIFKASAEVRNSIVFATLIIIVAFLPLFALSGMEGRMFQPVGIAYIMALLASLVVSLTVVPALSVYLLARRSSRAGVETQPDNGERDTYLMNALKQSQAWVLRRVIRRPLLVIGVAGSLVLAAVVALPRLGREFLPSFNEGTLTLSVQALPGTSLDESNRIGILIERLLRTVPEVKSTARRTGRAELDEHAEGVNSSEIDVALWTLDGHQYGSTAGRPDRVREREIVLADIRERLQTVPGVYIDVGQPLSHRISHILSGVRAQVAVKVFGQDLDVLRLQAEQVRAAMEDVDGVVDLAVEPQVNIPQLQIAVDREEAGRHGLKVAAVVEMMEVALGGHVVSTLLEHQRTFDVLAWFEPEARERTQVIEDLLVDTPVGHQVPLVQLASLQQATGPNTINRENTLRRILVTCNVQGRDLNSVITDIQQNVADQVAPQLPAGYFITYGGQFEAQQQAMRQIVLLGGLVIVAIGLMLFMALQSPRAALLVMVDLPLALVGGVLALVVTGGTLSVASLIGFITVFGIATRNGIMMVSHYLHLMREEGERFDEKMVLRGTRERLRPVLMTALVTAFGALPLALSAGQTGKEILQPLAVVILGGIATSTFLDQIVTPTLFLKFGHAVPPAPREQTEDAAADALGL